MDNIDAELLMLAGEDDADVKASSPAQPSSPAAPSAQASSPGKSKKRPRSSTKKSRKKARRDSVDNNDAESETLSDDGSGHGSGSERDAPMDLESSDDEGTTQLYPLEGKYKDLSDKEKLMSMTEVERESILAERQGEIEKEYQDRHLRNLLKSRQAAEDGTGGLTSTSTTRKSSRTKSAPKASAEATKRGKLDEMRKNREERSRKAGTGSRGDADEDSGRRRSFASEDDDEKGGFANELYPPKEEREITVEDCNRARFGRTGFAKLCDYPGFEECAQDCFVRVALYDKDGQRNVYRICMIKGFADGKPYSLLSGTRRTARYVTCVLGVSERSFPMDMCSDQPFTEHEFNRFKRTLEVEKITLPTLSFVRRKAQDIRELNSRSFTPQEVNTMIAKRTKDRIDTITLVLQRGRLRDQRDEARARGDDDEVLRLDREIQAIEDQQGRPVAREETQMERIARINAENRRRNITEIRKAEQEERRRAREAARNGDAFSNPFARVKTKPQFRHPAPGTQPPKDKDSSASPAADSGNKTAASPLANGTPNGKAKGVGVMGAGAAASTVSKMARRKGGVDDVIANLDLGIEIEL